jgi:phage tail tape-measure protein
MNSIDITSNVLLSGGTSNIDRSKKKDDSTAGSTDAADATLRSQYASTIRKALESDQSDAQAVQQAREALISAQLDTYENIEQTAENILKFGI